MVTVDIQEVFDRLSRSRDEEQVCLIHPREAEELVEFLDQTQKEHDRAEWIWIAMYLVVFWSIFFFGSGGKLVAP